ncbi:MAG: hypothetical protein LC685_02485 [Actinobacteria bacterium]|nr:hypothetical protein [Actinomycetota bacterium]
MSRVRRVLTATLVAWLLAAAAASADVGGPDDSIAQAFGPLAAGTLYSGSFVSPTDVDYLAFEVTQPGQTLHFDVANTVHGCLSAALTGCPVYATLIDGQGLQLGGEGSSAGTGPVTEGATDVIDWTFDATGVFYVAVDSDGDLPTYTVQYRVAGPGGGTGAGTGTTGSGPVPPGSGPGRPIALLRVSFGRHGAVLRAQLKIGRALHSLTVRLEQAGRAVAVAQVGAVAAGRRTVALRLDAATRRALARTGRPLRLSVGAVPVVGKTQTLRRPVHLPRR